MAVSVASGSLISEQHRMHPFFAPVKDAGGPRPAYNPDLAISSLDGASDDTATLESNSIPGSASPQCPPMQSEAVVSSLNLQYAQTQDNGVDISQDRRKRRKVSPEVLVHEHEAVQQATSPLDESQRQLPEPDSCVEHTKRQNTTPHPVNEDVDCEVLLPSAPQRRSSRLVVAIEPKESILDEVSYHGNIIQADVSAGDVQIGSEKKMLKLTASGRLGLSPNSSPKRVSPRSNKASRSTKLTLKNGRIAKTLPVAVAYKHTPEGGSTIGNKIDEILSGQTRIELKDHQTKASGPQMSFPPTNDSLKKPTHPFFLGKPAEIMPASKALLPEEVSATSEPTTDTEITKPWNEIAFRKAKPFNFKETITLPCPWPPTSLQHVRPEVRRSPTLASVHTSARSEKHKTNSVVISDSENILTSFGAALLNSMPTTSTLVLPKRCSMSGTGLLRSVQDTSPTSASQDPTGVLNHLENKILHGYSAFDLGQSAGQQEWAHQYSPKQARHALQPQATVLQNWLERLKVHHVQSTIAKQGLVPGQRTKKRRGRPKKHLDDLDDFIVSSEDEDLGGHSAVKNAILICGPHGCGKTASIYAAAQATDFEVFEIHPGMRRSAKDIFDKVGDMTHNHLVRPSAAISRQASTLSGLTEPLPTLQETHEEKQLSMANFVANPKKRTRQPALEKEHPASESHQKQSLILLEEVDILFEEDRAFWTGVQDLIQQSKRPVIMTCNSLGTIPMEDLILHDTLIFKSAPAEEVVPYLTRVAASEGHILCPKALHALYVGRGLDLRASLADLNFWCQMTVGSSMGGLDWMGPSAATRDDSGSALKRRIVSRGTYHYGLDTSPELLRTREDVMSYAHSNFGFSASDWEFLALESTTDLNAVEESRSQTLNTLSTEADVRSSMDVCDELAGRLLSCKINSYDDDTSYIMSRSGMVSALSRKAQQNFTHRTALAEELDCLMEDNRTFPPTTGRGGPSLDGRAVTIATEVAPYIRSIVAYDQALEDLRNTMIGEVQGKRHRTTRAARAAMEGGDKANTRRERWFPKDLDFAAVLSTGGVWPQYQAFQHDTSDFESSYDMQGDGEGSSSQDQLVVR